MKSKMVLFFVIFGIIVLTCVGFWFAKTTKEIKDRDIVTGQELYQDPEKYDMQEITIKGIADSKPRHNDDYFGYFFWLIVDGFDGNVLIILDKQEYDGMLEDFKVNDFSERPVTVKGLTYYSEPNYTFIITAEHLDY